MLPVRADAAASRLFQRDLTQFWAYGRIAHCTVTFPATAAAIVEEVFGAIPGREHLTHLQVMTGNRTLSAAVDVPVPVLAGGTEAEAVNFLRRQRFFILNQDLFPPRVLLAGVEYRVFYRDANDPAKPRPRALAQEACRHLQTTCGIIFALRTADQPSFVVAENCIARHVGMALRWCEGPEPHPRQLRLPEGLAHLLFDSRTTDAFPFGAKLATTHALDEYRARPGVLPLMELNAIAREPDQDPDDLLPFALELADDLAAANNLLRPVWRTHREDLSLALRELQGRFGVDRGESTAPVARERDFTAAELAQASDPEGWTPPRLCASPSN